MRVLAQFIKNSSRQLRSKRAKRVSARSALVQLNTSENSPILYESLHTHAHTRTHHAYTLTRLHVYTPLTPLTPLTLLTPLSVSFPALLVSYVSFPALLVSCVSSPASVSFVSFVLCCPSRLCYVMLCCLSPASRVSISFPMLCVCVMLCVYLVRLSPASVSSALLCNPLTLVYSFKHVKPVNSFKRLVLLVLLVSAHSTP